MAGNYPNVPSWRIPYDRDGTMLLFSSDGVSFTPQDDIRKTELNSETVNIDYYGAPEGGLWVAFMFPRLMDIDAYYLASNEWGPSSGTFSGRTLSWSPNTTTGADGSWTGLGTFNADPWPDKESMRTAISGTSIQGARSVKFYCYWAGYGHNAIRLDHIHLYGEPTAGQDTNKLEIIQPATENRVPPAYFDFGDVPRNSTNNKTFRVKNLSSTQTAVDIIVSLELVSDATPSFDGMHTFQHNAGGYLPQINIGSLAPGGVSDPIDVRQVMDSSAALGLRWARIVAAATSWS